MVDPPGRRLQRSVLGLLFGGLGVVGVVFTVGQLQSIALSDAIQREGALATASTVRVVDTGAHGGAELEVRFATARGQQVRTALWDGRSDAVAVRRTLAVRYLPNDPTEAEPAGQQFNTVGQAVLDLVVTVPVLGAAILLLLSALGFTPLARLGRALAARAARTRAGRPLV